MSMVWLPTWPEWLGINGASANLTKYSTIGQPLLTKHSATVQGNACGVTEGRTGPNWPNYSATVHGNAWGVTEGRIGLYWPNIALQSKVMPVVLLRAVLVSTDQT